MKGFIELTSNGRNNDILYFPVGKIGLRVTQDGVVVVYDGYTWRVNETISEIAAKIEAATEQKTETCEWCDENFRYTQGGMEKRRYAYDTEDIDIGCWRYCPVCGRKVEVRG